jgi:hypothetical protein
MLAELGSAAETAQKLAASATKIAEAIEPRRPVEGDEVFMVVSWIVDEGGWICPKAVAVGRHSKSAALRSSKLGFQARRNAMHPRAAVHETGPKVGERG